MQNTPEWKPQPPEWSKEELSLLPNPITTRTTTSISLEDFSKKSENFARKFPLQTNRCKILKNSVPQQILERNINSAYPILHENALHLYAKFILHKRKCGNAIEKKVYKDMNLMQFIDRLLTKRAVSFVGKRDFYSLLDGKRGMGHPFWELIGTPKEKGPLKLQKCISYDEVKLSAFLSVSSLTYFLNIGDRRNVGVPEENRSKLQDEGIIIGIIGPRLVKPGVMDYQELVISKEQNTKDNGYGSDKETIHTLFSDFYGEECWDHKEVIKFKNDLPKNIKRYTELKNYEILDNFIYYKRLIFSMDTLFLEANERALRKGCMAYVHVVGIGLGVWRKHACQKKIFMDSCAKRIKELGDYLHNISDICFAYIQHDSCGPYNNGDVIPIEGHPKQGIKIHLLRREPHEKLEDDHEGKLLVVSYAGDGNALPGNEYWNECLDGSGDSAAASSTQISELHNAFINPNVSASNLRIATFKGVLTYEEYFKKKNIDTDST